MIENWYRNIGLLPGNKTTRWVRGPNSFSERLEIIDTDKSAEVIQRCWRGFLGRRDAEYLRSIGAETQRVYWTEDGEMRVINLNEAARKIQSVFRGWSVRLSEGDRERMRDFLPVPKVIHGLTRGGKKNPLGSFWVSKKKDTVLASGFVFQKGGDQRWAVGMKSADYCPCHIKIDMGTHYMCLCQCPSTLVARSKEAYGKEESSGLIYT